MALGKIIVTGANGLIGHHVAQLLYAKGYEVIGIYRTNPGVAFPWAYCYGDLLQQDIAHITGREVDVVVHCAAVIPKMFTDTEAVYRANRNIDQNIISFVRSSKAGIIFISSTSLYGFNDKVNREEDDIIIRDEYSRGKYESEQEILDLNAPLKTVLRINAPYAPDQRNNTVLKMFIEKALAGEDISYHGTGNRKQDFTHADDIANAVLQSVKNPGAKGIFNISGGAPVTMKQLAKLIISFVPNYKGSIVSSGIPDTQENFTAEFSTERASQLLKWSPFISIEQGIEGWINYSRQ